MSARSAGSAVGGLRRAGIGLTNLGRGLILPVLRALPACGWQAVDGGLRPTIGNAVRAVYVCGLH